MSLDDIIEKQLVRLETQRDRLAIYLCDTTDINSKITIERMIADIDFKVIGVIDKINQNMVQHYDAVIEHVNKIAKDENLKLRCTSLFELYRISIDSRQDLDKLKEKKFDKQGNEINDPDLIAEIQKGANVLYYHETKSAEDKPHIVRK